MVKKRSVELYQRAAVLIGEAEALDRLADTEQRDLSETEQTEFANRVAEAQRLQASAARAEQLERGGGVQVQAEPTETRQVQPFNITRTRLGDSEARALAHYVRTGDMSVELRASNATDMNIGTPADGGYAVPTGHYNQIVAKRNEGLLAPRLGVTRIPGLGTTVNAPVESGSAEKMVQTNEAASYDLDAPILGQKAMTLVKYTKKIVLSEELLADEDSRLLDFLANYVGRAFALTHNDRLVTEVLANGTIKALTGTAAAAGHIPTIVGTLADEYSDSARWLVRRAVEFTYRALQGDSWLFNNMPAGGSEASFWGYPVYHSGYMPAIAASAKVWAFGDWSGMGMRELPGFTFQRDPYSAADTGQVVLRYSTRFVYKVLNADALIVGQLAAQ